MYIKNIHQWIYHIGMLLCIFLDISYFGYGDENDLKRMNINVVRVSCAIILYEL